MIHPDFSHGRGHSAGFHFQQSARALNGSAEVYAVAVGRCMEAVVCRYVCGGVELDRIGRFQCDRLARKYVWSAAPSIVARIY